jgi:hypothetical protein
VVTHVICHGENYYAAVRDHHVAMMKTAPGEKPAAVRVASASERFLKRVL